jgi:hypothetical protein
MKLILIAFSLFISGIGAYAQSPTPTPVPPPEEGGIWVRIPVNFVNHPDKSSCDYDLPAKLYPIQFAGATSIKIITKAQFDSSYATLSFLDGSGESITTLEGEGTNTPKMYETIIPADRVTVSWKCQYFKKGSFFEINEAYVALP